MTEGRIYYCDYCGEEFDDDMDCRNHESNHILDRIISSNDMTALDINGNKITNTCEMNNAIAVYIKNYSKDVCEYVFNLEIYFDTIFPNDYGMWFAETLLDDWKTIEELNDAELGKAKKYFTKFDI